MLLEESLCDKLEGFILLGDDGYLMRSDSVLYLLTDIIDNPGYLFEFILESSLTDGSSRFTYSFEAFYRSFEYITNIVQF